MKKLTPVIAIIILLAFIVLFFRSLLQDMNQVGDGTENTNRSTEDALADMDSAMSDYFNKTATAAVNSATTLACADDLSLFSETDWYTPFTIAYQDRFGARQSLNQDVAVTLLKGCLSADGKIFVAQGQQPARQLEFMIWWDIVTQTLHAPAALQINRATVQVPADTMYYDLQGWLNPTTWLYSTQPDVSSKQYHQYLLSSQSSELINHCTLHTETVVCGQSEAQAWGCEAGTSKQQINEQCSTAAQ